VKYRILVLILCVVAGCKKVEIPEPKEEKPVFFSDLKLGDRSLNLVAGQENIQLETRFAKDEKGIITFIGVFRPKDCPSLRCPQSMRFAIRDFQLFNPNAFRVENALKPAQYGYSWFHHRDSVNVVFEVDSIINNGTKIEWNFDQNRVHLDNRRLAEVVLSRSRSYKIELKTKLGNFTSRQVQTINLQEGSCRAVIRVDGKKLAVRTSGKEPFKFHWNTGETTRVISLDRTSTDLSNFAVTVTDVRQCESISEIDARIIMASNADRITAANFNVKKSEHLRTNDPLQFGQAAVEYINAAGDSFSSQRFSQPVESEFKVLSVSDFTDNEQGQRTKKIELQLSCLLYGNSVDQAIQLSGKVTMAVAYPD